MQLTHSEVVATPADQVWAAFMDLKRVGSCFPGAEVTQVRGDDFDGVIRVGLGFFKLTFEGNGTLTVKDREAGHARIVSTGRESHGLGHADITIDLHLSEVPAGTRMDLTTELVVRGLPTRLGNGLAQRISGPLVGRFLRCMAS